MIQFEKFQLDNGLKVLVHQDSSTPMAVVNVLYNVGAKDEDPSKTGFAHLFEHLMFGGSVNIPVYDEPLQRAGGENNAYTTNDLTNYYCQIPAENLETAFWLESDRMLSLAFSEKSLAKMKERENRTYVKNPDPDLDNLERGKVAYDGEKLYQMNCRSCHQKNGQGDGLRFPSIAGSNWVNGNKDTLIAVLLRGLEGPIKINNQPFSGMMPKFSQLTDPQIADLLSYVRHNFGNKSDSVTKTEVAIVRQRLRLKMRQLQQQKLLELQKQQKPYKIVETIL